MNMLDKLIVSVTDLLESDPLILICLLTLVVAILSIVSHIANQRLLSKLFDKISKQ